jgi:hypothetical protein
MSCTNPNCNEGCGCNNCCPPVTPPTPPVPPTCTGTECEELYDGACVQYTGPSITCLGITTNTSLNSVIQAMANKLCECCKTPKCTNPITRFVDLVFDIYYSITNAGRTTTFDDIFLSLINPGYIIKKCEYCCPDGQAYMFTIKDDGSQILNALKELLGTGSEQVIQNCVNCESDFTVSGTALAALQDTRPFTVNDITEYGGFNSSSGLSILTNSLKNYPEALITEFLSYFITNEALIIACNTETGDLFIGNLSAFTTYTTYLNP